MSVEIVEEQPSIPFVVKNEQGVVVFRDALVFPTVTAMRNSSAAERKVMREQRYAAHLAALAEAAANAMNEPPVEEPPVED